MGLNGGGQVGALKGWAEVLMVREEVPTLHVCAGACV